MLRPKSPGRATTPRSGGDDLAREIASLSALDPTALKQLWATLCGAAPPPGLNRPLLIRALAYRMQERALGGLKPATRRFLLQVSEDADHERTGPVRPPRAAQPGMVLVREWHGTSHRVTVLETACAWRGKRYRSLSEVARAITGTRWSGPRFFGLGRTRDRRAANGRHPA
jgi:hypothetical protein